MSPIHFRILERAFRLSGYRMEILPEVDREGGERGPHLRQQRRVLPLDRSWSAR